MKICSVLKSQGTSSFVLLVRKFLYLLSRGCKFNKVKSQDFPSKTPLHYAVQIGNLEMVKIVLDKGALVDATDMFNNTALYYAAVCRNERIVELLLSRGSRRDVKSCIRFLVCGPKHKHYLKILQMLLNSNNFTVSDEYQDCLGKALQLAVFKGNKEIFDLLLTKGVDTNIKAYYGETLLHISALNGRLPIVRHLVEQGFSVDCVTLPSYDIATIYLDKDRYLSERSCNNNYSEVGYTPLHLAVYKKHYDVAKYLLHHGANVDHQGKKGKTPLHIAFKRNKYSLASNSASTTTKLIKLLLNFGSDINITTKKGHSPLFLAKKYTAKYSRFQATGSRSAYTILINHIRKLRAADLYVSPENYRLAFDETANDYGNRYLSLDECRSEFNVLKNCLIVSNISYHDILTKSIHQLAVYARNKTLLQSFNSGKFDIFPIYSVVIHGRFRMGLKRNNLFSEK